MARGTKPFYCKNTNKSTLIFSDVVAEEKRGLLPTLNFWLSENCVKQLFVEKFLSKNANSGAENTT